MLVWCPSRQEQLLAAAVAKAYSSWQFSQVIDVKSNSQQSLTDYTIIIYTYAKCNDFILYN